jgi:IS605 OrfB family transposase
VANVVSTQLLEQLWSEKWLDKLNNNTKKAYTILGDQHVVNTALGQTLYLPSRIRRCISERVGRILRSQVKRRDCYYAVLRVVQMIGVEGNLDRLVKTVACTLIGFERRYYKRALIRQTLRTFRWYHYRIGMDLAVLLTFPYTKMVHPRIRSFNFPYAPDDGQAIQLVWVRDEITIQLKLPQTPFPIKQSDWFWQQFTLKIPSKILQRVFKSNSQLLRPSLRYITLKGGFQFPFLNIPFSIPSQDSVLLCKNRVLSADLGVINLLTSVVCEAGSQISLPFFWSPNTRILNNIDQLYYHISRIQKRIDRYPNNWIGKGKLVNEQARLYGKLNRYRNLIPHLASNVLIEKALHWRCSVIVLEDLRTFEPPKHKRKLSRKLSSWLRGALYKTVIYKARRVGIVVKRVSARWTSSYCPRCGHRGQKIMDPMSLVVIKTGRFFHCTQCSYLADRDYVGAVNIYRMYQEHLNKRHSIRFAKLVSYTGTGIPLNRPSGASTQDFLCR